MNNAIGVKITGELGNQMFGAAAGYKQALRLNSELILDFQGLPNRLNRFKLDSRITCINSSLNNLDYVPGSTPDSVLSKVRRKYLRDGIFKSSGSDVSNTSIDSSGSWKFHFREESSHIYSGGIDRIELDTILEGYFQSWKYVNLTHAKNLFSLSSGFASEKFNLPQEFTALHIRIYSQKYRNFHGLLSLEYYQRSLKLLEGLNLLRPIVIFTDNPREASSIYNDLGFPYLKVFGPDDIPDQVDNLLLMSQAHSLVGANSSYSWWAAALSEIGNNGVVFPRPWYRDSTQTERDLLKSEWLTIGFSQFHN